jgi:hypothetical protein
MLTLDREILSFRTIAILPIALFTPTLILGVALPGSKVGAALGMLFHLSVLFLVSRMPAPDWARAAGFAWLALDITSGAMTLNNVPYDIAFPVRLGGHVLAATWIITAALLCRPRSERILGVVVGLWLGIYTFFGSVLPVSLLAPPGVLVVVWFGLLAWHHDTTPTAPTAPTAPTTDATRRADGPAVGGVRGGITLDHPDPGPARGRRRSRA